MVGRISWHIPTLDKVGFFSKLRLPTARTWILCEDHARKEQKRPHGFVCAKVLLRKVAAVEKMEKFWDASLYHIVDTNDTATSDQNAVQGGVQFFSLQDHRPVSGTPDSGGCLSSVSVRWLWGILKHRGCIASGEEFCQEVQFYLHSLTHLFIFTTVLKS